MFFAYKAKKHLGQNFLNDEIVIQQIIDSINPSSNDIFIEIGPGMGAITLPIAKTKAKLHGIELDQDLYSYLSKATEIYSNINLYHNDALSFKLSKLGNDLRVIGNLPYNISTPLLFHILRYKECIKDLHFMLQKEVADRLCASPGNKKFGRLSIMFGAYMRIKHLFDIPNTSFKPIPKVTSSFVSIKPKLDNEIIVKNNEHLALIVKKGFSQRRKTIKNALKGLIGENILIEHEIDPFQRPEEISILKWSQLSNVVTKNEK